MFIYIAAPFFKPEQIATVRKIEGLLDHNMIPYFSPRSAGILLDMAPEERKAHYDRIYNLNIDNIHKADTIVAVIDDRDIGTIWEIGYAAALKKDIITYTGYDYGLNIMLAHCIRYHSRNMNQLANALTDRTATTPLGEDLF